MAVLRSVRAIVRNPQPPFTVLAGPIDIVSQSRFYASSELQEGSVEIAVSDMSLEWARVGMCWQIESDLGEPPWAGFVAEESWEYGAASIKLPLSGPIAALLQVKMPESPSTFRPIGHFIQLAIEAGQVQQPTGLRIGSIDLGEIVDIEVSQEIAADFIWNVRQLSDRDFLERAVVDENGDLEFFVDYGYLDNTVPIVLGTKEIVTGIFRRARAVQSLTIVGGGGPIAERHASTVTEEGGLLEDPELKRTSPSSGGIVFVPKSPPNLFVPPTRDIGPGGSGISSVELDERIDVTTPDTALRMFSQKQRDIDEIFLTLDTAFSSVRDTRVGDRLAIDIKDWTGGLLGVDAKVQVLEVHPHEEDGTKDVVLEVLSNA